jgi:hypothetical protein
MPVPGQEVVFGCEDPQRTYGRIRGGTVGYVLAAWEDSERRIIAAVLGCDRSYREIEIVRLISRFFQDGTYAGPEQR